MDRLFTMRVCDKFQGVRGQGGYTLLEALVALALFVVVVIPVVTLFVRAGRDNRVLERIVASSILEQETVLFKASPAQWPMSKQRTVEGKQWTLKSQIRGGPLYEAQLSLWLHGHKRAEVYTRAFSPGQR